MVDQFKQHGQIIPLLHCVVDEQITNPETNATYHQDVDRLQAAIIARSEQLAAKEKGHSADEPAALARR